MTKIKLSVVVPSYNESLEIKKVGLKAINDYLSQQLYSYEVLIVDDKSTNNTVDEVEKETKKLKNFFLIRNEHGGKAVTVMTGLLKSVGEFVIFTDMDQATPIDQTVKILTKLEENYDIAIGSRQERQGAPIMRKLAAMVFQLLRNLILGLPFKDTQCGFKGFDRQAVRTIFPQMLTEWQQMRSSGAAVNASFDVEFLLRAKKIGLKIAEVEVKWHHIANEKQVNLIKEGISSIKDMIRIRFNDWSGKYS